MRILILGGTGEARALAGLLVDAGHDLTSALAGRTQHPALPKGAVRIGGFGGAEGLADWLVDHGTEVLIDATHPFAAKISANAVGAAERSGVRLVRLERPAWVERAEDTWVHAADLEAAIAGLAPGARVLLTTGSGGLDLAAGRVDCTLVARMIERPASVPEGIEILLSAPPFTLEDEMRLLADGGFTDLVTKNSGGVQTAAKLVAARTLGVRVTMIARPALPQAETVESVTEIAALVERLAHG